MTFEKSSSAKFSDPFGMMREKFESRDTFAFVFSQTNFFAGRKEERKLEGSASNSSCRPAEMPHLKL